MDKARIQLDWLDWAETTHPRSVSSKAKQLPQRLGKSANPPVSASSKPLECTTCGQPIQIPGLDRSYCPNCGWVRTVTG